MSNIAHRSVEAAGGSPEWRGGGPRGELLCYLFGILAVGVHLAYTVIPGQATERQCFTNKAMKQVKYLSKFIFTNFV